MLVHLVEAPKHRPKIIRADREHCREADRGVHRVAAPDPIPEPEHVGCVDAKLRNFLCIGGDRYKVGGDCFRIPAKPPQQPVARESELGK